MRWKPFFILTPFFLRALAPVEIFEVGGSSSSASSMAPQEELNEPKETVTEQTVISTAPQNSTVLLNNQLVSLQESVAMLTGKIEELDRKIEQLMISKPATVEQKESIKEEEKLPVKEPTPQELYDKGKNLLSQGDHDGAEKAFAHFVKKFTDHELAPSALYWLGEVYFIQKKFSASAKRFLEGYQKNPKGPKAPDNLLKLALSLEHLKKNKEACATLKKLFKDHPQANASIETIGEKALARMKCS